MEVLVTGSAGLIGASVVDHFGALGHRVTGIDNNMRATFFGPEGNTRWVSSLLEERHSTFTSVDIDIRDGNRLSSLVADVHPDLVVHAAAQPSHDLAASMPRVDFDVNAGGTLNTLEAVRLGAPAAAFVFMSTNKVYGDAPNELPMVELETRYDYALPEHHDGVDEQMRLDASMHSIFGVSKASADLMVQEYGRYFGLATVCLRGGCLTGGFHSGVALHGFLSYLVKTALDGRRYDIHGYKGKQVRDNLHGSDVARFCELFAAAPRSGAIYNLGGGRANSCSILEAAATIEAIAGTPVELGEPGPPRLGDHQCYISDTSALLADYGWAPAVSLHAILEELVAAWRDRGTGPGATG